MNTEQINENFFILNITGLGVHCTYDICSKKDIKIVTDILNVLLSKLDKENNAPENTINMDNDTMNIFALQGHKVIVTDNTKNNGSEADKEMVSRLLKLNTPYTVLKTEVESWSTRVFLEEFPKLYFNCVTFEDVDKQSIDADKLHPDWNTFNR